jgi:phage I-like protein
VTWTENAGTWVAADGTRHDYELVQHNPRLNHLALTASPRVAVSRILALDSEGTAIWVPDSDTDMEELQKLLGKLSLDASTVDALKALLNAENAKVVELTKALDSTRGERDALQAKLEAAPSLDSVADQVARELAVIGAIAAKVPGLAIDSLSTAKSNAERYQLALDALKVKVPAGSSEDYLRARFDGAVEVAASQPHPGSGRAAIMAQDNAPKTPSGAERIRAIQDLERRRSRGEEV